MESVYDQISDAVQNIYFSRMIGDFDNFAYNCYDMGYQLLNNKISINEYDLHKSSMNKELLYNFLICSDNLDLARHIETNNELDYYILKNVLKINRCPHIINTNAYKYLITLVNV